MAPDAGRPLTRDDLVRAILGTDPEYTSDEIARVAEVDVDVTRRLWRALGFPEYDEAEVAFTRADVDALSLLQSTVDAEVIDFDTALNLTRALGTTMARLADWEVAALVPQLPGGEGTAQTRLAAALALLANVGEPFEHLLIYAFRRHLAAAVSRIESLGSDDEELKTTEVTVGFADIVAFTALSNEIGEERVGDLVEVFESRCHDVVSSRGGRVIKSLGDSVLFISDDPVRALEIADGIIGVIGRDPRMPDVRLGLASGGVVMRMGDVFGPPVNLAARLTAVARRNRVIVDEATSAMLPEDRFDTRALPARPLRGFGLVEPIAVRVL
ncbi:adenylate/guanylate cyclase domain-containing protein [Nocardioides sp. JQ2195]|uniref:adenylate/guanylate cyclase domain-containing protein n=1 Tax=Nocardioides sp. JQ2195 TaxID=2592334 RepID=UPI00143E53F3|nr:adenylate/guanylate cyclase domain-containing protein [Nocardioides sp. JQ2195]QIX25921.1 adenylate/guanylate cyclase domain-containing protein [Nocardioides sp. JQ2195]